MQQLDNLVKINKLNLEPPDQQEIDGMLHAAQNKFKDCQNTGLSQDSRFTLAYSAAHALSLAALRWQGYRSDNRYLVFQCLAHTLNVEPTVIRILSTCHNKRNLAEYEGHLTINDQLLEELISTTQMLLAKVIELGAINND